MYTKSLCQSAVCIVVWKEVGYFMHEMRIEAKKALKLKSDSYPHATKLLSWFALLCFRFFYLKITKYLIRLISIFYFIFAELFYIFFSLLKYWFGNKIPKIDLNDSEFLDFNPQKIVILSKYSFFFFNFQTGWSSILGRSCYFKYKVSVWLDSKLL